MVGGQAGDENFAYKKYRAARLPTLHLHQIFGIKIDNLFLF
ncbi:hypothetical protein BGP_4264 [Beggiatoa sp. PS]|nr:hypothetical protein BGP_4264 [Beggiatoa sp. PS]